MNFQKRNRAPAALAGLMLLALAASPAMAQMQMTFFTQTAPHAAVGVPIKFQLAVGNTGNTSTQVKTTVVLIPPAGSSTTLLSTKPTVGSGQTKSAGGIFVTNTLYPSVTGAFTLRGTMLNSAGTVILAQQDIPVTIVSVPANGVFVSIGGQGPASALLGMTTDYQTVTANLGGSPMSLTTKTTFIKTDLSEVVTKAGTSTNINPGANTIVAGSTNSTLYSGLTGTYGVRADVLDSGNNILASDTFFFTRNPLPTSYFAPTFTDNAAAAGITVDRMMMMMEGCGMFSDFMMGGSGAAVADYDQDGKEDLFVVEQAMGMNKLYHNNGDGTFTDMAMSAGIPQEMEGMMASGAAFADIDNDGYPDLLITFGPDGMLMLLHNNGDGTFSDITATSGLMTSSPQNFISATWGDFDNDGFVDLYVAAHMDCMGMNTNDHLFHNNGNMTFTDVTSYLGGPTAPQVTGRGLVATFVDYNQDGRVDLYVGNDEGSIAYPNVLWRNDGPDGIGGWKFTDVSAATKSGLAISDMGIAIGDYNRDGFLDLFNSNVNGNVLLQGQSNFTFLRMEGDAPGGAHVARALIPDPTKGGVGTKGPVTWGSGFYDFNNDGWEDLYTAGGNIHGGSSLYPGALFVNNGDGTFLNLTILSGTQSLNTSMPTAVFADFNNDGLMDFFQMGSMGFGHLMMNNGIAQGNPNHWLEVKLVGKFVPGVNPTSNRDAIGARVTAMVGGAKLFRTVYDGATYQGNNTLRLHFGLGSATQVDSMTINWPGGQVQVLGPITSIDQIMTIGEP